MTFSAPANILHLLLALILAFSGFACTRSTKILSSQAHRETPTIPQDDDHYGNAYAYENKIRGDLLLARGDIPGAITAFKKAIIGAPEDSFLRTQLAIALIQGEQFDRARVHLAKALLLNPSNGLAWRTTAELHLRDGNPRAAVDAATMGYQADRSDVTSLLWLAEYYRDTVKPAQKKKSLHYFQLALIRCRTRTDIYFAAASMANELSYTVLATRYFQQYLFLRGKDVSAVHKIASAYEHDGNNYGAIALYQEMLTRQPENDRLRKALIRLNLKTGDYKAAVRHTLSMNRFPSEPEQIMERTNWLIQAHAPWEARTLIIENFSAAPTHPVVRLQLANVELELLRFEIANILLSPPEGFWPEELMPEVEKLRARLEKRWGHPADARATADRPY